MKNEIARIHADAVAYNEKYAVGDPKLKKAKKYPDQTKVNIAAYVRDEIMAPFERYVGSDFKQMSGSKIGAYMKTDEWKLHMRGTWQALRTLIPWTLKLAKSMPKSQSGRKTMIANLESAITRLEDAKSNNYGRRYKRRFGPNGTF